MSIYLHQKDDSAICLQNHCHQNKQKGGLKVNKHLTFLKSSFVRVNNHNNEIFSTVALMVIHQNHCLNRFLSLFRRECRIIFQRKLRYTPKPPLRLSAIERFLLSV